MPFLENARLDVGMTDGAQVDGVKLAQLLDGGVGQRLSRTQVPFPAEIEVLGFVAKPKLGCRSFDDFKTFPDDFGTRPVAGNDRDLVHNSDGNLLGWHAKP